MPFHEIGLHCAAKTPHVSFARSVPEMRQALLTAIRDFYGVNSLPCDLKARSTSVVSVEATLAGVFRSARASLWGWEGMMRGSGMLSIAMLMLLGSVLGNSPNF